MVASLKESCKSFGNTSQNVNIASIAANIAADILPKELIMR